MISWKFLVKAFMLLAICSLFTACNSKKSSSDIVYQKNQGTIFHTFYSMTYSSKEDLREEVMTELQKFDGSLSMFNDTSVIARVNKNDSTVLLDDWFCKVFRRAMEISQSTNGAFDITVAPFVNAWGFGFKKRADITQAMIDSIRVFVGYQKVKMENEKIIKDDPRLIMDASAIAKGFASDIIADFFNRKGVDNYMIEIGGEVVVKGANPKGEKWKIGINKPVEDSIASNEIIAVLALENIGLATSGNYRNYYVKDGKKYAHTIDPSTGYPVQHSLLSASVLAKDCMTADALATSFMVMGLEKSMEYVNSHSDIRAYFIYADEDGNNQIAYSQGMEKYIYKQY